MSFVFRRQEAPTGGGDSGPTVLRGQALADHIAAQRARFHLPSSSNSSDTAAAAGGDTCGQTLRQQLEHSKQCSLPSYHHRVRQSMFPFVNGNDLRSSSSNLINTSLYGHHSTPWAETFVDTVVASYSLTSDERLVSCRWSPSGQDLCVLSQDKLHFMNRSSYTFKPRRRADSQTDEEGKQQDGEAAERKQRVGQRSKKSGITAADAFLKRKLMDQLGIQSSSTFENDSDHDQLLEGDTTVVASSATAGGGGPFAESSSEDYAEDEEEEDEENEEIEEEEEDGEQEAASIALIQMLFGGGGGMSREVARQLVQQMQGSSANRRAEMRSAAAASRSARGQPPPSRSQLAAFRERRAMQEGTQDLRHEGAKSGVVDGMFHIHNVGWSLLDCSWSADSQICAVGGWSSTVHLYRASEQLPDEGTGGDGLLANNWTVRPKRRMVPVDVAGNDDEDSYYSGRGPGVFSMAFMGNDNNRIACGTNENVAVVVDIESQQLLSRHRHMNDVNTVAAFDPNIFVSGSDDHTIKVHDTRAHPVENGVGFLLGHASGLASVDCHSDGYHLVSAGKDQCCKLWDMRRMTTARSSGEADRIHELCMRMPSSDYRRGTAPPPTCSSKDHSLLTFQGQHYTLVTLCRARISPTGRYVACASAENAVGVYDILTGEGKKISAHSSVCRDVSWHPTLPLLTSVSWDGCVKFYSAKEYLPTHETKEALVKGAALPTAAAEADGGGADDDDETQAALMGLSPSDFYDALEDDSEEDEEFY